MDLYQSLVTVNPVTLIAQICNLFLQMFLVKVFFLDKIKAILDARREAADKEITDAKTAKEEAMVIKATYEQNMLESKATAEKILQTAQQNALKAEQDLSRIEIEAKQKVTQAEAEAEAIRKVTEAIQGSKADPSSYLLAVKYIDSLKEMVSGKDNKTVYVPYEATSVLSSLGSIKELLGQSGK